jgi:hypothetical protein
VTSPVRSAKSCMSATASSMRASAMSRDVV